MPTLIIAIRLQKQESRPWAAFDSQIRDRSTFRVLLAPPRLVEGYLFSLHFARIARHEARSAEDRLQRRIIPDQRTRDAMPHGARLGAFAPAVHVHADVEAREALGEIERLANDHAPGLTAEEFIHRLAVDHELAFAELEKDTRYCALAPPDAVVIIA